ncbi:6-phosphogluconolactonase [Mesorhizobium sp. WSM2239]|uniref:6-phosphogluconolactonase n=2 Tax=unclassified Mesorhizobium TaxID=325217 RepID=A0AAU8D527_9HYPH
MADGVTRHEFASREELAERLASAVADVLRGAIERRGTALLAVSGGSTPALFFRQLSQQELDWDSVTVTLVDERFVPEDSPRSNARLVRENLLRNKAATARFTGLFSDVGTVEDAADRAGERLSRLSLPLDAVVLGMGTDGHTASFFPDAGNLGSLLDPSSEAIVAPVHAASGGEPRLTLTLARIVEAGFVALHIEGAEKRRVLEAAFSTEEHLPVRAVPDHAPQPVQVFWAP